MEDCICEDADGRLQELRRVPSIDSRWIERIQAARFLNRFEIQRNREAKGDEI